VATLFTQNGVPSFGTPHEFGEVERQLTSLEQELQRVIKSVK
jgi:hypothetical protein